MLCRDNRNKVAWVGKAWGKNVSWWRSLEFTRAMQSIVGHRMMEVPHDDQNQGVYRIRSSLAWARTFFLKSRRLCASMGVARCAVCVVVVWS